MQSPTMPSSAQWIVPFGFLIEPIPEMERQIIFLSHQLKYSANFSGLFSRHIGFEWKIYHLVTLKTTQINT